MKSKWLKFSSLMLALLLMTACGPTNNNPPVDQDNFEQNELEENDHTDINEENMNNPRKDVNEPSDWNDEKKNQERNKQLKPNNRNMNDQR